MQSLVSKKRMGVPLGMHQTSPEYFGVGLAYAAGNVLLREEPDEEEEEEEDDEGEHDGGEEDDDGDEGYSE